MKRILSLLLLLTGLLMTGCGSDSDIVPGVVVTQQGFLRFAHLSPDAPNVDIRVDGNVVPTNVPFRTLSRYAAYLVGNRRVQIFPTGTNNPVIDVTVNVTHGSFQTVAATGLVANLGVTVYQDTVINNSGNALVRVLHVSPDAPAVDLTLADGTVLAGNLTFPNATNYLPIAPGTYNLQIRLANTATVVRDFPGVQLTAGHVASAFAVRQLADQSFDVLSAADVPMTVRLPPTWPSR
jgi:hypothetical protein